MKKIVFGIGGMFNGLLLCIVAFKMVETTGNTVLPEILLMIGFALSLFSLVIAILGLKEKN